MTVSFSKASKSRCGIRCVPITINVFHLMNFTAFFCDFFFFSQIWKQCRKSLNLSIWEQCVGSVGTQLARALELSGSCCLMHTSMGGRGGIPADGGVHSRRALAAPRGVSRGTGR